MSEFNLFETPSSPAQAGLALARKWRPRDFSTLVGQDHVVKALTHALDQNRLHHAWLFTGTRGVGKTTISRILAKSLNCVGTSDHPVIAPTSKPCGTCYVCQEIDAGRFVDYVEMDAASNRGVDDMAALLERSIYGPTSGRFKVFMIDEVHMLTNHAFNSMLKTLEEPPPHLKFILATTDPQKIPVTVLSRCLQFNLKQMPSPIIVEHLQSILEKEAISAEEKALRIIAKSARGSMRDALSLTDQAIAYTSGSITEELVRNMLGSLDDAYLIRILDALATNNGQELVDISREMAIMSMSFSVALQDLASLLQKIAMAQLIPNSILQEWPEAEAVQKMATSFTKEEVQLLYQIAITSRADLQMAPEEEVGFLMALLRMLAFKVDDGLSNSTPISNLAARGIPQKLQEQTKPSIVKPLSPEPQKKTLVESTAVQVSSPTTNTSIADPTEWQNLVKKLHLKGLVGQFALQTALKSCHELSDSINLHLTSELPQLATTFSIEKLTEALEQHFKRPVRVKVDVGVSEHTVAKLEAKVQASEQLVVEASLTKDPYLQDLQNIIGVKVIEGSIRPLKENM
jgi:DNA polymerase-3 subunit gamma/tau